MFDYLHIYDPRERRLVGLADLGLRAAVLGARLLPARPVKFPPQRVLLLRLERIGDLVMTLDAIAAVRDILPRASLDLVVGSWNADLARLVPGVTRVETLDVPWLARGQRGATTNELVGRALEWRRREYDLAINFEGDIRSNMLLGLARVPVRAGFAQAGGGPLLTIRGPFDPEAHTAETTFALVETLARAIGAPAPARRSGAEARLVLPDAARDAAAAALASAPAGRPLIGLHTSGGREIKQWHPERFGEAASRLAAELGAAIVLTGDSGDRPLVDRARAAIPAGIPTIDLTGALDLVSLAAVFERLSLYVTGDTGPMHLAAAMATPTVAVFGPSAPARYAPRGPFTRVVRIDLWCAPCNQIRLPPERCRGHVPDCLEGITSDMVYHAAREVLSEAAAAGRDAGRRERPGAAAGGAG